MTETSAREGDSYKHSLFSVSLGPSTVVVHLTTEPVVLSLIPGLASYSQTCLCGQLH